MPLPTGTVTFLFTDMEGSTRLWENYPEAMKNALARHNAILSGAIAGRNGLVFRTVGDAYCAVFLGAPEAVAAALDAQRWLYREQWATPEPIRVRMAIHTGTVETQEGEYIGPPLNRVARLLNLGHGGQTLVSQSAYELAQDALPGEAMLRDKGIHRLRDLSRPEQVYQLCSSDLPSDFPDLKSLNSPALPNNLPPQMTSFIGRQSEIAEVKNRLMQTRALTLMGTGGAGKTRLALQVAAEILDEYSDGVWFVELAPLSDPTLVAQTVAQAVGVREQAGQRIQATLGDALRSRKLLIILDNCEHLIPACAAIANELLRACPKIAILATSREALNIPGEMTYRIPSLSLPDAHELPPTENMAQYESVRLFIERAAFHQITFALSDQNAPAIASVCRHLDGIPLAIELAAARIRAMSVEEIERRLDDRFRLLTGGSRTALRRQQTLRALVDWSYDLLSEQERLLLHRLCVFAGGWSLEAAEVICVTPEESLQAISLKSYEILDTLTSLVDKSLVVSEEQEGKTRYRLLETMRQYAREFLVQSGEAEAVQAAHRDYFLQVATEAEAALTGPGQGAWLTRLEAEHDNLRAGLEFALQATGADEAARAQRMTGCLWRFWQVHGHLSEGKTWLTRAINRPEGQGRTPERAAALRGAGVLTFFLGDYPAARTLFEENRAICEEMEDKPGIASALNSLGNVALYQGDHAESQRLLEESVKLRREIGDKRGAATTLVNLGNVALHQGDYDKARTFFEEGLILNREIGDRYVIAIALHSLGNAALYQGDYATARALCDEGLAIYRELGDERGAAITQISLGMAAVEEKNYLLARGLFQDSLIQSQRTGDQLCVAMSLEGMATLAARRGHGERAAHLGGAAEALRETLGAPMPAWEQRKYNEGFAAAKASLGEAAFAAAWAAGRIMDAEEAAQGALASRSGQ